MKVVDLIDLNSRKWNDSAIRTVIEPHQEDMVKQIPIGRDDAEDFWAWRFTSTGSFSVSSAYHFFHDIKRGVINSVNPFPTTEKEKWKWLCPSKDVFFHLEMCSRCLGYKKEPSQLELLTSPTCQVCNAEDETIHHCLFGCKHATDSWENLLPYLPTPPISVGVLDWLLDMKDFRNDGPWTPSTCTKAANDCFSWTSSPKIPRGFSFHPLPAHQPPEPDSPTAEQSLFRDSL
ncbi:unnamed protein product [Linum trigynum]|uniref:Reverse transcriptase zinc-binding domain-containing protein n=1 Tax=Linum trigynum TaxID=586398 RepID=A0AAV2CMY7_9ROSI